MDSSGQANLRAETPPIAPDCRSRWLLIGGWFGGMLAGVTLVVLFVDYLLPPQIPVDYIQFWTASHLILSGQNPYDRALQAEMQRPFGFQGGYPAGYLYPPWLALLWIPFLALGYSGSKGAWFGLSLAFAVGTSALLRPRHPPPSPWLLFVLVPLFAFSGYTLLVGQTSLLILFLATAVEKLLERGWDRSAGAVLAFLTIKPQLSAILIPALFLWAAFQRRWSVIASFSGVMLLFIAGSTAALPDWPRRFVETLRAFGWDRGTGATWFQVLQALGVDGVWLPLLHWAVTLPILVVVLRLAWRGAASADIVSGGLIGAFFLAPYSQPYDYTVLLLPLGLLLPERMPARFIPLVLLVYLVVPYIHLIYGLPNGAQSKFTLFWVPTTLLVLWLTTLPRKQAAEATAAAPAS